jgi:hypothetical protein
MVAIGSFEMTATDDGEEWDAAYGTLPDILGPANLPKLNEGLRYLLAELREAHGAFIDGDHADGAFGALIAVLAFVSLFRTPRAEGLIIPLHALTEALLALDEGIVEPILRPARRASAGRPRAPHFRHRLRGTVAYVVQRLCHFDHELATAHAVVATALDRVGVKSYRGGNRITARTVRAWCEEVAEDVGRHGIAAQRCDQLLADPVNAQIDKMGPQFAALFLVARLQYFAKTLGEGGRSQKPT